MNELTIIFGLLAVCLLICAVYFFRQSSLLKRKYGVFINLEEERTRLHREVETANSQISNLRQQYSEKKEIYDALVIQAAIYNEDIELAAWGPYRPHFDFDTSEKFKQQSKRTSKSRRTT